MTQLETSMKKRITTLEEENLRLKEQVAYLRKHAFGRKTEKTAVVCEDQLSLFDEAEQQIKKNVPEPEIQIIKEHKRKKYSGQKKELLENLPHEKKVITLPEDKRICNRCQSKLVSMGEEFIRSELEYIPAKVKVIDIYRETFECRTCRKNEHFSIEKPQVPACVLPHSIATPSAIAHTMRQKYEYAVPLYRQEKQWQQLGIKLNRATLANWIVLAAQEWLLPIIKKMHEYLLQEKVIHADETPVQVMGEKGRKNTAKSYMWLYSSGKYDPLHNIRIFEYQPGRKGDYAQNFLKGYNGYLHTDAYVGYEKVENIKHCLCWAHARRYFVDAIPSDTDDLSGTIAQESIKQINKLFAIEKILIEESIQNRQKERLQQEKPLLEAYWSYLEINKDKILPKSKLGKAINYALNNQQKLQTYLEDGQCDISNNLAENSIRPFTIGRKNWLFSGSPKGAKASAAAYSIIETCKANKIDAYKYLEYIFKKLPNQPIIHNPALIENYLPWSDEIKNNCSQ
ncbi:IS66 family transposase [Pectinatus brassicae]|uniref:IS66 family transposase n=1 Tax=Pectinatus brassicae TaxID=862415 RepID=UPI0018C7D497|nr:IS66 family transposase [Pectinatus brassicae]